MKTMSGTSKRYRYSILSLVVAAGLVLGRMVVSENKPERPVSAGGGADVSTLPSVTVVSTRAVTRVHKQPGSVPDVAPSVAKLAATASERFERDSMEWQGMRNERGDVWPCSDSGSCDRARACVEDMCVPCAEDDECHRDELCVLGACVLTSGRVPVAGAL